MQSSIVVYALIHLIIAPKSVATSVREKQAQQKASISSKAGKRNGAFSASQVDDTTISLIEDERPIAKYVNSKRNDLRKKTILS